VGIGLGNRVAKLNLGAGLGESNERLQVPSCDGERVSTTGLVPYFKVELLENCCGFARKPRIHVLTGVNDVLAQQLLGYWGSACRAFSNLIHNTVEFFFLRMPLGPFSLGPFSLGPFSRDQGMTSHDML